MTRRILAVFLAIVDLAGAIVILSPLPSHQRYSRPAFLCEKRDTLLDKLNLGDDLGVLRLWIFNPCNVSKHRISWEKLKSFFGRDNPELHRVLKYASLIYNTFGKEFIDGEISEAGLEPGWGEIRSIHFKLDQNYPNPFNPLTTISFTLPAKSFVTLKVFDMRGREVSVLLGEELAPGSYSRKWNAGGLPSGVYFYRLQAGTLSETRKLILLQ